MAPTDVVHGLLEQEDRRMSEVASTFAQGLPVVFKLCENHFSYVLYSKKFFVSENFVKSDRQAVRQEFIFIKQIVRFVFGRSVRLLIGYLHIHDCF